MRNFWPSVSERYRAVDVQQFPFERQAVVRDIHIQVIIHESRGYVVTTGKIFDDISRNFGTIITIFRHLFVNSTRRSNIQTDFHSYSLFLRRYTTLYIIILDYCRGFSPSNHRIGFTALHRMGVERILHFLNSPDLIEMKEMGDEKIRISQSSLRLAETFIAKNLKRKKKRYL